MKIRQGAILPSTAIGFGYFLLIVYSFFLYYDGIGYVLREPALYMLPLVFALMQFSVKDFIVYKDDPETFITRYRILGFVPFKRSRKFDAYSPYVIRVIRKEYYLQQIGARGKSSQTGREEYLAIVARNITTKKTEEICKGKKTELDSVIKNYILPLDIPIFKGAPKKGYEYTPE